MQQLLATLNSLLADPTMAVDPAWTDAMAKAYPATSLPQLLELQRTPREALSSERRRMLLRHVALNSPQPRVAVRLDDPATADRPDFYPPEPQVETPSTDEAINRFIDQYGGGSNPREDALLERLIFNPVADYSRLLADEEERSMPTQESAQGDSQDSLINAFIIKSRRSGGHFPSPDDPLEAPEPTPAVNPTEQQPVAQPDGPHDESLLSESLAKIFIKQGRYTRAFEIISQLNLKYPEKSVYFADQLRFLQKLIINEKYKNKK